MKKNYIIFLLGLFLSVAACSFTNKKFDPGENESKEQVLNELVTFVLENYHYSPKSIDDEFSKKIYDEYLKTLDPRKRFFVQKDIDEFAEYRESLDDQIRDNSVDFFQLTYNRLQQRIAEVGPIYKEILSKPFDFSKKETINTDYDNLAYPKDKEARKEVWRKQLKFNVLASYYDLKEDQEQEIKDHKFPKDSVPKTDAELEKEARKNTKHSLDQFYDVNKDLKEEGWFAMYLNTIAQEFDPHTGYFAPEDKDRFDVQMSGQLEGIGAQLQKDIENIKVTKLIPGGPAWRDGQLKVGDVIKKVKQEDEEKPVSIVGMPINDAVKLIKGPKGTKVTLTVKTVSGSTKTIEITRDIVELDETHAKSAITEKDGKKYGFIKLPSFYFDIQDYNKRNAASDMEKEIKKLKAENIDGLVVDLRNNGGGSLSTAIDIAGLFVGKGPVVQVRSGNNRHQVLKSNQPRAEWNGPLVILVNELSASASEILAAAMQDYGRAVIIGSKQTYGKGTVQKFVDLNRFMRNDDLGNLGDLKITTQKFYRINGGATQLKGVESDIKVPDQYSYIDVGERDNESPLPWDEIEPAPYQKWKGYENLAEVKQNRQKQVQSDSYFKLVNKNAKWIKEQRDRNDFSLNYKEYQNQVKENQKEVEEFDSLSKFNSHLTFKSLPAEIEKLKSDSTLALKRKRWHKNLSKDAYIFEALNTLDQLKLSQSQKIKMAKNQ